MANEKRLISVADCPCDGCTAKPCGHPARCVKFALWLNNTVNAVELPCKIGDYAYAIRNYKGHIHPNRGIVREMYFVKGMKLHIVVQNVTRGEWGKTVFGTYEEAERAIVEMKVWHRM